MAVRTLLHLAAAAADAGVPNRWWRYTDSVEQKAGRDAPVGNGVRSRDALALLWVLLDWSQSGGLARCCVSTPTSLHSNGEPFHAGHPLLFPLLRPR